MFLIYRRKFCDGHIILVFFSTDCTTNVSYKIPPGLPLIMPRRAEEAGLMKPKQAPCLLFEKKNNDDDQYFVKNITAKL